MSELEKTPPQPELQSMQGRLEAVQGLLEHNRSYYQRTNRTLSTFAEAALRALELPYFQEQLRYVLSVREDLDAMHTVKLLERTYQGDLLENDPEHYPDDYRDDPCMWQKAFMSVEQDDIRGERVLFNLLTRNVQSNIAERYKTVKLLAALYRDRFGDEPSHLDVGSSVLHGQLKLAFGHNTPGDALSFGDIKLSSQPELNHDSITHEQVLHRERTINALVNKALHQTVRFGAMMGTDITNVDDPSTKRWVESCSFYPDELSDITKRTEYSALEAVDPRHERVGFVRADFSNEGDLEKLHSTAPAGGYDIITFFTIFYQISAQERQRMLDHAAGLLSDNGIIVIQDAVDGNFSKDWNYTATIKDNARPDIDDQEILRWKTPRCNEARLGLGRLSLQGNTLPVDEALLELAD